MMMAIEVVSSHVNAWLSSLMAGFLWLCASYSFVAIVYSLVFHPLAYYPGPFWARVTPFYALFHTYRKDVHLNIYRCHARYGSIIRYSPARLVYNTPEALKDIYGHGKNTQKSGGYAPHQVLNPNVNTYNCLKKDLHSQKRRTVSQAFTAATLSSYEPIILNHIRCFCEMLLEGTKTGWPLVNADGWSSPQNIASWTRFLLFDIVSDLAYGKAFNLVTKEDHRWLVTAFLNCHRESELRRDFPWLFEIKSSNWWSPVKWIQGDTTDNRKQLSGLSARYLKERSALSELTAKRSDIVTVLQSSHDPKTGIRLSNSEVLDEASLMIAAGGETTSTALCSTIVYLSRDKGSYQRLSDEIRTTFPTLESIHQGPLLASCHFLRACLDEAMRLTPPTPGPLWREVCAGGAIIDGHHIPEGYEVAIDLYALHRNPKYFRDPHAFNPDRFMTKPTAEPTLKKPKFDYFPTSRANTKFPNSPAALSPNSFQGMNFPPSSSAARENPAFAPFLVGSRGCVGKSLAYLEMSLTLARLMWCMDFRAADPLDRGKAEKPCFWGGFGDEEDVHLLQFRRREDC